MESMKGCHLSRRYKKGERRQRIPSAGVWEGAEERIVEHF